MSSRKINVLCLVSSLCVGGAEKHTVTLANMLDSQTFDVHLGYLKPVEALKSQIREGLAAQTFCLHVRKRVDRAAVSRLREYIDSNDIDVILATNEYPALYALMARRGTRRAPKLVEVFHTTPIHLSLKGKLQMLLYRPVFRRCDLLVYVSDKQREYWRSHGLTAKANIVIHNGVDLQRFRDRSDSSQRAALRAQCGFLAGDLLIGICAALRPEKAHRDLLQALARLRGRGIAAKVLIVGDGPERTVIEQTIAALNLSDCAFITGFQDDVRPYLAICDVVVLTSHAETFSIAALEAMAMGKPLVLTCIGGAEEQVISGENGFLYEPGDIESLTDQLAALQLSSTRERMGTASRERVESLFSESRMTQQFEYEIKALGQRGN